MPPHGVTSFDKTGSRPSPATASLPTDEALARQSASHSLQRDREVQPVPTRSDTFTEAYRAPCLLGYSILSDPRTQAVPVLHPLVHRTSKDIPPSLPATAFVSLSAYGGIRRISTCSLTKGIRPTLPTNDSRDALCVHTR